MARWPAGLTTNFMARLFVDTWGWLALRDKRDQHHREAVGIFNVASGAEAIVTSDYVLDETFTLLFRRLSVSRARESMDFLMEAIRDGAVMLAPIHAARFEEASKAAGEVSG